MLLEAQAWGKASDSGVIVPKRTSGANARLILLYLSARLKSYPVTKRSGRSFSAAWAFLLVAVFVAVVLGCAFTGCLVADGRTIHSDADTVTSVARCAYRVDMVMVL